MKAKGDVVIGGLVAALKLSNVKQPRQGSTHTRYGMFDLEDMEGLVRTICWPEDYARLGEWIVGDAVVVVSGSIDRRAGSDETNLIVNDLVPIADVWNRPVRSVTAGRSVSPRRERRAPIAMSRVPASVAPWARRSAVGVASPTTTRTSVSPAVTSSRTPPRTARESGRRSRRVRTAMPAAKAMINALRSRNAATR